MIDDGMQQKLSRSLEDIKRVQRELPPSIAKSFAPLMTELHDTIIAELTGTYYTKTETDSKVATPGAIAPTTVTASGNVSSAGQVISTGIVNSPGTKANTVTVGYSAVYIDGAGNMGGNTSSRRFKQDITPVQTDYAGFLGLTVYKFRYIEAVEALGDEAAWEYGLIAEEAVEVVPWACFYEADGTTVRGINYDRLVVALLNVVQDHERRLAALET